MKIKVKMTQDPRSIIESQKIRNEVFVQEQGIPIELDLDGLDDTSYHALAYDKNQVVGTARLTITEDSKAVLARVAVMKEFRGLGIASKIVKASLLQAEKLNIRNIDIFPHEYLKCFYESFGFEYIEMSDLVGDHQLIKMGVYLKQ